MDHNKLFRAFEKARPSRTADESNVEPKTTPDTQEKKPLYTKPVKLSESRVFADMVPTNTILGRKNDLTKLVNHHPMSLASMKKNKLIYSGMKNKAVLNAYRELRIKLKQKSQGSNAIILMSSVAKDSDSILTALNLAVSYSLDQQTSALVIDCNPYSDSLSKLVTAKFENGLTDYVDNKDLGIDKIIYPSGIDRVSVIPAGSNHERAVELFSSSVMNTLLYELKNRYPDRNIIVNAPPVLSSSEARVLTDFCDLTVLTIPYGKSSSADIEDAVNAIGSENIAGVIYQQ